MMRELKDYFEIAKRFIEIENDNSTSPGFSPIFEFPFTNNYTNWINLQAKQFSGTGKKQWVRFYSDIIDKEFIPSGVKIPLEWNRNITNNQNNYRIGYRTFGVYLISDINEKLLYIGKCEYPPVIRLLDRLIPKSFNQMNNVPQIWDNYLSKGRKVKCVYFYGLSFNPQKLEYHLLNEYHARMGVLPAFNKKMPNNIV